MSLYSITRIAVRTPTYYFECIVTSQSSVHHEFNLKTMSADVRELAVQKEINGKEISDGTNEKTCI